MQKTSKYVILSSLALIILLCMSSASAVDIMDNDISSASDSDDLISSDLSDGAIGDDSVLCFDSSSNGADSKSSLKGNGKSSLKDSLDSVYYVDSDNLDSFFADGFLKDDYADSILVFNGEFNDKGILDIKSSNVTIIGNNSLLKDTVFCLESNNIMLAGLNFVWNREFSDNDNAGILVLGDNCTIYNCTIDYSVPETTTGFCVYAEGSDGDKIENFTLANSTINFVGNNLRGGWDYCIFVDQVENAMVYGNDINSSLPLRAVDYSFDIFGGVSMEAVGVFVAQSCPNLTFSSNKVFSSVNGGGKSYPTLDTLVIYGCNNAKIENNDIHVEDFNSKDGKDNYLQGIDLYFSNNVTIVHNKIDMITTGGRAGMGTAYPIQVNGPSKGVLIAYNNLTTFNYGPNCGIYSMNYYGQTQNYMISNFINVTGVASTHYYALVAGIEVQDSDDLIWNNTIIVNNIGEYSDSNNIYGISYSQSTDGNHTYNIQYNNVTTNGRYAVSLSGSGSLVVDSIIANNVLNTNKSSGNRAVHVGAGYNNTIRNNTDGVFRNTLNPDDLPDWLKNHKGLVPRIVVPKYYREGSNGSGLTDDEGNGAAPWNTGSNPNGDTVFGSNRDTAPGFGGDASPSFTAASPGESGSSAADPNAYEIDEHDSSVAKSSNYLQLGLICIVTLLLLIIGYKRQKDKEEEE